jgi:hypothetical protein
LYKGEGRRREEEERRKKKRRRRKKEEEKEEERREEEEWRPEPPPWSGRSLLPGRSLQGDQAGASRASLAGTSSRRWPRAGLG